MNNSKTKIENGIAQVLKDDAAFAGVNIYPFSDSTEAADSHPTIIVKCESAPRDSDLALEMHAFHPAVVMSLFWDNEQGDSQAVEGALDSVSRDLDTLQAAFNYDGEPDTRLITGIHVHYIESTDTQSETEGTIFRVNVTMTLFIEEVIL